MKENSGMKSVDILVWALLMIGGLIGFLNFNAVGALFGEMTLASRIVYALVGLAALYDIIGIKAICKRWDMHYHRTPTTA